MSKYTESFIKYLVESRCYNSELIKTIRIKLVALLVREYSSLIRKGMTPVWSKPLPL